MGAPAPTSASNRLVPLLVVVCFAFAVLDVVLVLQNGELRRRLDGCSALVQASAPSSNIEGLRLPDLGLRDARGEALTLGGLPLGSHTLLLVSSPSCDYCEDARPLWERVALTAVDTSLLVFGVVLEAEAGRVGQPGAAETPYPLVYPADRGAHLFELIAGVPAALLLDADGVVVRAIYGPEQVGLEAALDPLLKPRGG